MGKSRTQYSGGRAQPRAFAESRIRIACTVCLRGVFTRVVSVINVWRIFHSYVRIPLVVETFARDGMAAALLNPQLQALLEAVLFEPLEYARTWRHVQPPLYV